MHKNEFLRCVKNLDLEPNDYIVVGSGILCVLKIREALDVDIIVTDSVFCTFDKNKDWQKKWFEDGTYYLTQGSTK